VAPVRLASSQRSSRSAQIGAGSAMPAAHTRVRSPICTQANAAQQQQSSRLSMQCMHITASLHASSLSK
jgi:hypothetical protein